MAPLMALQMMVPTQLASLGQAQDQPGCLIDGISEGADITGKPVMGAGVDLDDSVKGAAEGFDVAGEQAREGELTKLSAGLLKGIELGWVEEGDCLGREFSSALAICDAADGKLKRAVDD